MISLPYLPKLQLQPATTSVPVVPDGQGAAEQLPPEYVWCPAAQLACEHCEGLAPLHAVQDPFATDATPEKSTDAHAVTPLTENAPPSAPQLTTHEPNHPDASPTVPSDATVTAPLPAVVTVHPIAAHCSAVCAAHLFAVHCTPAASEWYPARHLHVRSADAEHAVSSSAPAPQTRQVSQLPE